MPRILVVDDDALVRAVVVDAVRACGFEPIPASGGAQALDLLATQPFAGALVDVRMPDIDGFEVVKRARQRGLDLPMILVSVIRDAEVLAEAARRGVSFSGFVPKPVSRELVGRILARWCAPPLPIREVEGDEWSGEEALRRVKGPVERFPPARILFLAHRIEATGALLVEHDGRTAVLALRSGKLTYARGIPGMCGKLPAGVVETGDLLADLGAAIAAGRRPDDLMAEAGEVVVRWAVALVGATGGLVRWDPTFKVPAGAFALPVVLPRVLAASRAAAMTPTRLEELWGGRMWAPVRLRVPDDSNELRWGLDTTAMRAIRAAGGAEELGAVIERTVGIDPTRRSEVLRAVDLLFVLGLLRVGDVQVAPTASGAPPPVADPAQLATLRARLAEMEGRRPSEILGVADKPPLTPNGLTAAHREISRSFHPDNFFSAAPEVRTLAEACFSRFNTAYQQLQDPAVLEEENRYLDAKKKGIPYVSDGDRSSARVSFRRGELHLRNRDWKEADVHLSRAAQLDPLTWPHGLMAIQAGWLARRLTSAEALEEIGALRPDRPEREAEALTLMGTILKLDGKPEDAIGKFRLALARNPENRDAQRELRLHERRSPAAPAPGLLAGILPRKS